MHGVDIAGGCAAAGRSARDAAAVCRAEDRKEAVAQHAAVLAAHAASDKNLKESAMVQADAHREVALAIRECSSGLGCIGAAMMRRYDS